MFYQLGTTEPWGTIRVQANNMFSWCMWSERKSTFCAVDSRKNWFLIGIFYFNMHANTVSTWHETTASWIIEFYFIIDCKITNSTFCEKLFLFYLFKFLFYKRDNLDNFTLDLTQNGGVVRNFLDKTFSLRLTDMKIQTSPELENAQENNKNTSVF